MKRAWIKLYLEILDDPKMGRMADWLWRRAVELFLLAGENGDDGVLQPVVDMAWRLRTSGEKLTEALQALSQVGVVHETPQGWKVTNFAKRQAALTGAERNREYRRRKGSNPNAVTKRPPDDDDDNVTDSSSSSSSSSGSVSESQGERVQGEGAVFTAFERNIGALTPFIADGLKADIDDYSAAWVIAAIEQAARAEKRSLGYVEGALKNWRRDGLSRPPPARMSRRERNQPVQLSPEEEARLIEQAAREMGGAS